MDTAKLRELLAGTLELKPVLKKSLHSLVDQGRFIHLGALASIADLFTDMDLGQIEKEIDFIDGLSEADRAVLDEFLAEAVTTANKRPATKSKKSSGSKRRRRRSTKDREAAKAETQKIRGLVRKLHDRDPKQSNQEIQTKLERQGITASLQKINGFRAHFNGVGFHGKGKKSVRKKGTKK